MFRDGGVPSKGASPGERNPCDEYALGQRRFWEQVIRDESDFARPADSIHYHRTKHGWVR